MVPAEAVPELVHHASALGDGRREQVAGSGSAAPPPNARFLRPFGKQRSTAKPYEPFPLANMAPNSPSASPLIPSEK